MNAVWRPPDQHQIGDEAVELRLKNYEYLNRAHLGVIGIAVLVVLFEWLMGCLYTVVTAAMVAVVVMTIMAVWYRVVVGGWLPAARKLLADSPSRRVTARVVAHRLGRTVVAAGDVHLRVLFADRGLRQVIANTGEITLVGPDAHGRAVVFVDGGPLPLPAKIVAAVEQSQPEPTVDAPKWFVARQAGLCWLMVAGALLAVAGFAYDAQQPMTVPVRPEKAGTAEFNWFFAALCVGIAVAALVMALGQHRLARLLDAGQWQAYPATLVGWKGDSKRPNGDLTLQISLPDGQWRRMMVRRASPELMANVYVTATLWVVGPPAAGKLSAVGVPGHPIVAPARFV